MNSRPFVDDEFRPVAIIAVGLALVSFAASLYFLVHPSSPFVFARLRRDSFYVPLYFFIFVNALNAIVCVGVLSQSKWGYHLFRTLLYMLLFGFPIGTLISYSTRSYIQRHHIERYFGLPPSERIFSHPRLLIAVAAALVILFLWMMLPY